MKKTVFAIAAALAVFFSAEAQPGWRNLELELGASVIASYKSGGASTKVPFGFSAELRYNLSRLPLDFGAGFSMGTLKREWKESGRKMEYAFRSATVAADWNFGRRRVFSPFVGAAVGFSFRSTRHIYEGVLDNASVYS